MQNILVTGGSGFIGSNFIQYVLGEAGYTGRIVNLDSLTYAGNPLNLADVEAAAGDQYRFVLGDIRDAAVVAKVMDEYEIDAVCHFAAESHVDRSIISPDAFIQTNIVGTWNLLDAARRRADKIRLFHHVSTDEVYGSLGREGYFTETTPYAPTSPYSASKASSDHLVRAYGHTFGLPFTLSNCSNNYGPYQFPEKLIPLMILNAVEGKPLPVYGDGSNVRDWLYVRDHAVAVWSVMQRGRRGETYNIGGRCERSNLDVVQAVCDLVDELAPEFKLATRRSLITFVKDRPGHDWRYAIDCRKIETELGWTPQESFETGLRRTVQWFLANPAWVKSVKTGSYREWITTHYGPH